MSLLEAMLCDKSYYLIFREMSNGEKEGSIESDISTAVINTLTTPIVPLSKCKYK